MLFQSLPFAIFLPIVLAAYWPLKRRLDAQNVVIALASAVFYAYAGWRLVAPLVVSTLVAYAIAIVVDRTKSERARTTWLAIGIAVNLGLLAYFKYANFFLESFAAPLSAIGVHASAGTLHILLPLGISFYTFRTISYMVDAARGDVVVERSIVRVFTFVSFFPYLLAGPVERSKAFLPQLARERSVGREDVSVALRLILMGLFKKIVIADSLAAYVDYVFVNYAELTGSTLAIGVTYFTLQLYADFSGYSDIAVGVAKLFGFEITQNFRTPLFARSIADFWRRWHISLYNWFNDYLFGPLSMALRDLDAAGVVIAVVATFTLSGLWHGAGWGFVVWGLLHGLYFVPLVLLRRGKGRAVIGERAGTTIEGKDAGWIALTFACVVFANVFFRSPTLHDGLAYARHMFSSSLFSAPNARIVRLAWVLVLPAFEWIQRNRAHSLDVSTWHYTVRYALYAAICLAIVASIKPTNTPEYLYFKF